MIVNCRVAVLNFLPVGGQCVVTRLESLFLLPKYLEFMLNFGLLGFFPSVAVIFGLFHRLVENVLHVLIVEGSGHFLPGC